MAAIDGKPGLALIVGSGFSAEARLPTTADLSKRFLTAPLGEILSTDLEESISAILRHFWQYVFNFTGTEPPSLEDHFTVLDLAANSGHHLGREYPPKRLRAIRRMSIHRIFQLLDLEFTRSAAIEELLDKLGEHFDLSLVNLNWDIVAERHIRRGIHYGIEVARLDDTFVRDDGVTLLKLHGSSNWVYCDCCHRVYGGTEKSALHRRAFLEVSDFESFEGLVGIDMDKVEDELGDVGLRRCGCCGNTMAGRVATFSYRKAFSINQFQTIWDRAHEVMSRANTWLFVGYSMPEADFEFRHLLKSAQLARREPSDWKCEVVLKGDAAAGCRYMRFFGMDPGGICQTGMKDWVRGCLDTFCRTRGLT